MWRVDAAVMAEVHGICGPRVGEGRGHPDCFAGRVLPRSRPNCQLKRTADIRGHDRAGGMGLAAAQWTQPDCSREHEGRDRDGGDDHPAGAVTAPGRS